MRTFKFLAISLLLAGTQQIAISTAFADGSSIEGVTSTGITIDTCDDYETRRKCDRDYEDVGPCKWTKACSWDDPVIGGPRCQGTGINPTGSDGSWHLVNCSQYTTQSTCVGDKHGMCFEDN